MSYGRLQRALVSSGGSWESSSGLWRALIDSDELSDADNLYHADGYWLPLLGSTESW
jgi:hypothetical protein